MDIDCKPSNRSDCISVVGLGYVGLPLARLLEQSGCRVIGIDVSRDKIRQLREGKSYITDLSDEDIQQLLQSGLFTCSTSFDSISQSKVIILCIPSPLTSDGKPDLSYMIEAAKSVSKFLKPHQLVVLESSTFPGTTEDYLIPILEQSGLTAGTDFYVAYSPERINPGDTFDIREIPKVIGGFDDISTKMAAKLYGQVFRHIAIVSSIKVAELTKILENTQRFINISLMNELAMICNQWKIDLWEAIDAASTKPYGFMPYYPGPGIGGHCIPVDPLYLSWLSEQSGHDLRFIKLAHDINESMPHYVVKRLLELCTVNNPKVLLIGVTYKPDVNDLRESTAVKILDKLLSDNVYVNYHDPLVPEVKINAQILRSVALTPDTIKTFDVVAIITNHANVDYDMIKSHARVIFDTRNVFQGTQTVPTITKL